MSSEIGLLRLENALRRARMILRTSMHAASTQDGHATVQALVAILEDDCVTQAIATGGDNVLVMSMKAACATLITRRYLPPRILIPALCWVLDQPELNTALGATHPYLLTQRPNPHRGS